MAWLPVAVQPWGERIPVGKDNLLLRECVIKNTDFVEGLVVYAGHESKVCSPHRVLVP
jgi:phospholipid-translocating ATPase